MRSCSSRSSRAGSRDRAGDTWTAAAPGGESRQSPVEAFVASSWLDLMNAGQRGDEKQGPLWSEPSVRAIVVRFAECVRALAFPTTAEPDPGHAQADRNVRVGARCLRRHGEAERF